MAGSKEWASAEMLEAPNESFMRKIAVAFEQGDLRPLFDALDEQNVVWKSGSAGTGPFRFGGIFTRRAGVIEVTSSIASDYKISRFYPKEVISKGDIVWGLFDVDGEFMPTGKKSCEGHPFEFECAIRWRLHHGKIVEHQSFFDTDALFRQIHSEER